MKITGRGIVYQNDYGYTITDSRKNAEGNWDKYYIPCNFKRGQEPENGTMIVVTEGYTNPFKRRDGKIGISYFIADYIVYEKEKDDEEYIELDDDLDVPF